MMTRSEGVELTLVRRPRQRQRGSAATMWILCSCVVFLANWQAAAAVAGIRGDPELLNLMAKEHRANKERIATWSGRVLVTDSTLRKKGTGRRAKSTVDFAYDRKHQAYRWRWSYGEFFIVQQAGKEELKEMGVRNGMLKQGAYYELAAPIPTAKKQKNRSIGMIYPPERMGRGPMSDDLDLMYWFTHVGEPLEEHFEALYKIADDPRFSHWTVERAGSRVIVTADKQYEIGRIVNRCEVDLARGANVVKYEGIDPTGTETWEVAFERINDVWVPKTVVYHNDRVSQGTNSSRELRWLKNVVNKPIGEREFSLAALGLRPGDVVSDVRANTEFVYPGELASPVPKSVADDANLATAWIYLVIAVVVATALVLPFRRLQRKRRVP